MVDSYHDPRRQLIMGRKSWIAQGIVIVDDYYAWDGCSRVQEHGICLLVQR
jgi:hypothetical protein